MKSITYLFLAQGNICRAFEHVSVRARLRRAPRAPRARTASPRAFRARALGTLRTDRAAYARL